MNFLNVFEERVSGIFGTASAPMPFSFRKMAKRAAHEMENETYVINGVDTAPALYTILVSQEDDTLMRPVYAELTQETAQFLEAQAQRRGYSFIGQPLVRFMVDPSLKSGRFSAFAENVDARTLERLRDEEERFMASRRAGGLGGAVAMKPAPVPVTRRAPEQAPAPVQPQAYPAAAKPAVPVVPPAPTPTPAPIPSPAPAHAAPNIPDLPPLRSDAGLDAIPPLGAPYGAGTGGSYGAGAGLTPPSPYFEETPSYPAPSPAPTPASEAAAPMTPTAMLIDRQSGHTYPIRSSRAILGRERTSGGIVLRDPNVSRRHAEIDFDGVHWIVTDLNSTNGTLVNDVDVDECTLHDGDVITLGLTNLEFREG